MIICPPPFNKGGGRVCCTPSAPLCKGRCFLVAKPKNGGIAKSKKTTNPTRRNYTKNKTTPSPTLVRVGGFFVYKKFGRVVKSKMETSPTRRNQTKFPPTPTTLPAKDENGAGCPFLPPEGVLPVHRMAEKWASIKAKHPRRVLCLSQTTIFNSTSNKTKRRK